jgi:hypothetical protein
MTVRDLITLLGTMPLDAHIVYDRYSDVGIMKAEEIRLVDIRKPKPGDEWVQDVSDWRDPALGERGTLPLVKAVRFPGSNND